MANVLFKQGSQNTLNALRLNSDKSKRIPGAFYLTNDSHRLYICLDNTNHDIVPVNEGITTVTYLSDLPQPSSDNEKKLLAGQFYYVEKDKHPTTGADVVVNALAVYNGQSWVQINAFTDTKVDSFDTAVVVDTAKTTATVTNQITNSDKSKPQDDFKINVAGGLELSVTQNQTSGVYTLKIDASKLKQDLSSTVDSENDTATIALSNPSTANNKVVIKAGSEISISEDSSKNIVIAGTDQRVDVFTAEAKERDEQDLSNKPGGFEFKVGSKGGQTIPASIDPTIKLKNDTVGRHFSNGELELPVYTSAEVDAEIANKLKAIDGMTYKGTIGTNGTGHNGTGFPTSNVRIGDTYKVIAGFEGTVDGITATAGDVVIARPKSTSVKENNDGYLPSDGIAWDLIPSGNEDTTYVGLATSNGITLRENSQQGASVMGFAIKGATTGDAANKITVSDSAQGSTTAKTNTVTITHATPTAATGDAVKAVDIKTTQFTAGSAAATNHVQSTASGTAINNVVTDKTGHVTGLKVANLSFVDTNATLEPNGTVTIAANTLGTSSTKVTTETTLKQSGGATKTSTAEFTLYSNNSNLKVEADSDNSAVKVSLVWDSFE